MRYHKLVRDNIPDILKGKGIPFSTHIANDAEYWEKLLQKLGEEVKEFSETPSEEEMADIFEVLYAICDAKGIDRDSLKELRKKKSQERGGFKKKIILEETQP